MDRVGQQRRAADRKINMATFLSAAKLSDLQEGVIYSSYVDDLPVGLTLVNGEVRAFANVCTHDDGPLNDGSVEDACVVCPRHGAKFSLTDGKPTFPAVTRIAIYEVEVDGDDVRVKI
jgi:3-phenylpropionate/trans-cinnamate dioxygenase ferredoxin component